MSEFCKDCKHFIRRDSGCARTAESYQEKVTGKVCVTHERAWRVRTSSEVCPQGFEPKPTLLARLKEVFQ